MFNHSYFSSISSQPVRHPMFSFSRFVNYALATAALTLVGTTAVQAANVEGQLDPYFNGDGKLAVYFDAGGQNTDFGRAVAVQPDGKIVVAGTIDMGNGETGIGLARLLPNGAPDPGFGTSGNGKRIFHFPNTSATANAVAIQPDGRIVVAGSYEATSGNSQILAIRFNPDGHDTSGFVFVDINDYDDVATSLALADDGSIYLAGYTHYFTFDGPGDSNFAVVKLTPNMLRDNNFNGDGTKVVYFNQGGDDNDVANAVAVQPDGKLVIAGTVNSGTSESEFGIARLDGATGSPDTSFGHLSGYSGQSVISFHSSGTHCRDEAAALKIGQAYLVGQVIYVAGTHCRFDSSSTGAIAAVDTSGGLLSFFGTNGTALVNLNPDYNSQVVSGLALQPPPRSAYSGVLGSKLVLVGTGQATAFNNNMDMLTTRLDAIGSLDSTFGSNGHQAIYFNYLGGGQGDDRATAAAMDGNGYLVLTGFTQRSASLDYDYAVARLLIGDSIYFDGFDD